MAFDQDLRLYLEGLEHESPVEARAPSRHIDEHELHRHLLGRLRELENGLPPSRWAGLGRAERSGVIEQLFDDWSGSLAPFARYLETLPRQLAPIDEPDAVAFACRVLDAAIDCFDPEVPLVDRLELQRIAAAFHHGDATIESYALENRLVRPVPRGRSHRPILTELGRVFLRLRGKDAVRWLVTNEVLQSTGPSDSWHASHDLLEAAVTQDGIVIVFADERGDRYSTRTLDRLTHLGVTENLADGDPQVAQYLAVPMMRDVVQAALEPGPWHTAIRALLDDERAMALPGAAANAAEATIEQTKLIAHEVRNALIPVRHDVEVLRELVVEPLQQQRIDAAKQGVVRVLDFIEAMVQMSELITEPSTHCEIGAVVDEALGWIDTGRRVDRRPFPDAVHLLAPRVRLARAISNIVGNALQATAAGQAVRLSIERTRGGIRVLVDDGGPGVPIEVREWIFQEGVTLRQDGTGSGFGLAFARRVVEGAVHGKIWCEDSDLGGARFVIEVPEASP